MTTRNAGLLEKVALASLATGLALTPLPVKAQDKKEEEKLKLGFSTSVFNSDIKKAGFVVGKGPVNQSTLSLTLNPNDAIGSSLTLFGSANYDISQKAFHEIDFGLNYNFPLLQSEVATLSAQFGAQHWSYPSGILGKYDNVGDIGFNLSTDNFKADLLCRHLFSHGSTRAGDMIYASLSKPLELSRFSTDSLKVSLTPAVSSAFLRNFLQTGSGFAHVTPRLSLSIEGKKTAFETTLGYQFELDDKKRNNPVIGANITYKF